MHQLHARTLEVLFNFGFLNFYKEHDLEFRPALQELLSVDSAQCFPDSPPLPTQTIKSIPTRMIPTINHPFYTPVSIAV